MEYHPRLNFENLKINKNRIVLGSFPTWSLSDITNVSADIISEKIANRNRRGEFPYYYGSSTNLFWKWYKSFVDLEIESDNIQSIVASLERNKIGITDVIKSCERKGKSALDHHLTNRSYNLNFFEYPSSGNCLKILCTSKGVLNQMFLTKSFFNIHENLNRDKIRSDHFQLKFLEAIDGDSQLVKTPIFHSLDVTGGGTIECLAIPSPGSPFRGLINFGLHSLDLQAYLNAYIKSAFNWLVY